MGGIRAAEQSIVERMNRMTVRLTVLLGIPVIAAMIMTMAVAAQYARQNERMNIIAGLKPIVETEIPETVWNMVSGRVSVDGSGVMEQIQSVNQAMERVTAESGGNQQLELVVARRTMETLTQYVEEIRTNIQQEAPVVKNEQILAEVRAVAALVVSMLNNYITEALSDSALMMRRITWNSRGSRPVSPNSAVMMRKLSASMS